MQVHSKPWRLRKKRARHKYAKACAVSAGVWHRPTTRLTWHLLEDWVQGTEQHARECAECRPLATWLV